MPSVARHCGHGFAYSRFVYEERIENGGVPARLFRPEGATGLLLLGHGGGYSKDGSRFVRLCRRYAEATGLAVVCIDAVAHGERQVEDAIPGSLPRQWHSTNSPQMVRDWQTTVQALSDIGPPLAYVGFSMGALFGFPTVAAMPSIKAAVFVVSGYPDGGGIDDEPLKDLLSESATRLQHASMLMLNTTSDHIFPIEGVHQLFDATRAADKQLSFWEGEHNDWSDDMIAASESFICNRLAASA